MTDTRQMFNPDGDNTGCGKIFNGFYQTYEATSTRAIAASAAVLGYDGVDTARSYSNEKTVNSGLPQVEDEKLLVPPINSYVKPVLAEHLPETKRPLTMTKTWDLIVSEKTIQRHLRNFRGHIDILLLHSPYRSYVKRWAQLHYWASKYKIPCIGVSNFTVSQLEEIKTAGLPMPAVNQIELSCFLQQQKTIEYCVKNSIQVIGYSCLARGQKLDNPTLVRIAKKHKCTPANVMINWVRSQGFHAVVKAECDQYLKENLVMVDLDIEDMYDIRFLDCGFMCFPQHKLE